MPKYDEVKTATIALLSMYSHDHDIVQGYGKPPNKPKYSADTKLATVGINAYVRRAMMKPTNERMRKLFRWRSRTARVGRLSARRGSRQCEELVNKLSCSV